VGGPSFANREGKCSLCQQTIFRGDEIRFKKGARRDGSEVSIPIHAHCPIPAQARQPLPPGSGTTSAMTGGTPTASPNDDPFVNIGAWVRSSRLTEVVEVIKRAKKDDPARGN
jgi:hypothetical protein